MLGVVSPGATVTIETFFYEKGLTPFKSKQPASYEIRDPEGDLVTSGFGEQDIDNPARWTATVTLPENLIQYPDDQKYYVGWNIERKLPPSRRRNVEYFTVYETQDFLFNTTDRLLIVNKPLLDVLSVPSYLKLSEDDFKVELRDENGNFFAVAEVAVQGKTPKNDLFSIKTNALNGANTSCNNGRPFVVAWEYEAQGIPQSEFHFVYLVDTNMILMMNDLRKLIDKARNEDININLQFTEVDLVHYLLRGLARVNATPPNSGYGFAQLPANIKHYVILAAAYEAVVAQRLAEGLSVFDFGGQSVTLSVDRTGAYDAFLSTIENQLTQELAQTKRNARRSGSLMGALAVQPSSASNRFYNASGFLNSLVYNSGFSNRSIGASGFSNI